jgi:hypothetical protein
VSFWALVLKAIGARGASESADSTAESFWKREALVYQSGLLDARDTGLLAPRCFEVIEVSGNEYWIWMESIQETDPVWSLERYQLAARHLGRFNGSYSSDGSFPAYPWLCTQHIQGMVAASEPVMLDLHSRSQHRRSFLRQANVERTLRLYAERERLLDKLDRLPRCLCHRDAFRRNLVARRTPDGHEQTVAVDWSRLGTGAIGEDLAIQVFVNLLFLEVPRKDAFRFSRLACAGYLEGLHDISWRGNEAEMRFGYAASAALLALGAVGIFLAHVDDDDWYAHWELAIGHSLDTIIAQWSALHDFALDLGDEALAFLGC